MSRVSPPSSARRMSAVKPFPYCPSSHVCGATAGSFLCRTRHGTISASVGCASPWLARSALHSALSTQHSALSTQHSVLSTQYSALSTQHSALCTLHCAAVNCWEALPREVDGMPKPRARTPVPHAKLTRNLAFNKRVSTTRTSNNPLLTLTQIYIQSLV